MADQHTAYSHARSRRRSPQNRTFAGEVGLTVLSAILPGSGYVAAGRRFLGYAVLTLIGVAVMLGVGILLVEHDPRMLAAELASRPGLLTVLGVALLVIAAVWVVVIVTSNRMVRAPLASAWQRGLGILVVLALCAAVIWPSMLAARAAFATHQAIGDITAPQQVDQAGNPVPPPDRENPWQGRPRVNILLLGADAGEDREGLRTDTVMVASVDTSTGDTVLFSLPRNLQGAPFPEDNPLAEVYPNGYRCGSGSSTCMLNGLYREAEEFHAELFEGTPTPGLRTLRGVVGQILGLDLDYYLMVDLQGFERIVDALGGIDIDVGDEAVPIGGLDINGNPLPRSRIEEWIQPGLQHLNGYQTLWFARDRASGEASDYMRMRRQRCVINALVDQADPGTVIANYLQLVNAAGSLLQTDIPPQLYPAFLELSDLVKAGPIRSLPFTDEVIVPSDPDYREIRQLVRAALAPPAVTPSTEPSTPAITTAPPTTAPPDETPDETPSVNPSEAVAADAVC